MKLLLFLLLLGACEPEWMKKCRANGGHVESYNCRQVAHTSWVDVSADPEVTINVPVTTWRTECDHKCVGANAEAMP